MNWKQIAGYATCLVLSEVVIGFLQGYFGPDLPAKAMSLASLFASLVAFIAIFAHMTSRQSDRPFSHATLAAIASIAAPILVLSIFPVTRDRLELSSALVGIATIAAAISPGALIGNYLRDRRRPSPLPIA